MVCWALLSLFFLPTPFSSLEGSFSVSPEACEWMAWIWIGLDGIRIHTYYIPHTAYHTYHVLKKNVASGYGIMVVASVEGGVGEDLGILGRLHYSTCICVI